MTHANHSENVGSNQELAEIIREDTEPHFRTLSSDPKSAEIEEQLSPDRKAEIWNELQGRPDIWQEIAQYEHDRKMYTYKVVELSNDTLVALSHYRVGEIIVDVISKSWALPRIAEMSAIFDDPDFEERRNNWEGTPISIIAKKIGATPKKEFIRLMDNFPVTSIRDDYHGGVIPEVMHLVKYLNELGITTNNSGWGGHANTSSFYGEWREDEERPYISISGKYLREIVELMLYWKEAGGLEYEIFPTGGHIAESFHIEAPKSIPIETAQKDFEKFADHLAMKFGKAEAIKRQIGKQIIRAVSAPTVSIRTVTYQVAEKMRSITGKEKSALTETDQSGER